MALLMASRLGICRDVGSQDHGTIAGSNEYVSRIEPPGGIMAESGTGDVEERIARLEQQDQRLTRALELLAQRETAPPGKARRNWDAYAAVIASLIGVVAVGIAGYTAYVQRQQLRAQVWPYLQLWQSDVNVGFYITNQGTGPARIIAARVMVDGTPRKTWSDVQKAAGLTGSEITTSTVSGIVLPAGKDYVVIQPREDEQSRTKLRELFHGKHAPVVTICYCSVLAECWATTFDLVSDEGKPRRGDTCPVTAAERFDN